MFRDDFSDELQIAKFEFFIVKEILKPIRSSNSLLILEPIRMSLSKSDLGHIIYHMCSGNGVGPGGTSVRKQKY